ncbi:hypothetical protein [Alcanivorax sp.]|uniref:hypothetical protein n=1 Tax=Alcanivorax sp. TaxID=1872427 RepID=UPI00258E5D72|nr:hypothetical protein [Alcanivorax sp.]
MASQNGFDVEIAPLTDQDAGWEESLIRRRKIDTWVNDRLDTEAWHAEQIKLCGLPLVTFDDRGAGAEYADLHVAALVFGDASLGGRRVLKGPRYLVLDPEIERFRRKRSSLRKIVVSMGGADTHGVTLRMVELLADSPVPVTVVAGPGYRDMARLKKILPASFELLFSVDSLAETFHGFDLAVTAGGVTPFEAAAAGLPTIIIATETFEIAVGEHLAKSGCALFAGYHSKLHMPDFDEISQQIAEMSEAGMAQYDTAGAWRILDEVRAL